MCSYAQVLRERLKQAVQRDPRLHFELDTLPAGVLPQGLSGLRSVQAFFASRCAVRVLYCCSEGRSLGIATTGLAWACYYWPGATAGGAQAVTPYWCLSLTAAIG